MAEDQEQESIDISNALENAEITNARQLAAYVLMSVFVILTSIGAFLIYPPAGFVVAGIGCGIYAYLLGAN